MKILFASSSFGGGGITSYAKDVITNFSEGNDFSVLIGNDNISPIITPNVKIYRYECSDLSIRNAKEVIRLINNVIKPELIISSNAWIISLVAKYLNDNIKIVTVSHSLRYEEADMAAISYKYIDKVIAASSIYNKRYLEKRFNFNGDKIDVVLNFVDQLPNALERMENKKRNTTPCIISFPGGASGSKSPDIVLKIALELIKTDLDFILYWNKSTKITGSKLKFLKIENIKDFLIDPRVKFTGRLPTRDDAVEIISSAHIFLAPSRREGCPIALLEAMRVGAIPLVADFSIANKDIISNGKNGYIIGHNDIQDWVARISDIIKQPQKYNVISDNSYETFIKKFIFPVWKSKMEKVIYECKCSHKARVTSISSFDIFYHIIYFKVYLLRCKLEQKINEGFKVLFEFIKIKYFIDR